jgi:hypothetical protein
MTLELRSEQPEVQPPCFEPVITGPRIRAVPRRTRTAHDRHNNYAAQQLIAANPPPPAIEVTDGASLHEVLRQRADSLEISRSTIDHISGLQDGFSAKLLSLNKHRNITMDSLGPLLDALCLKLVAVPDDEAFARNRSRLVKRDDAHYRSARQGHDTNPKPPSRKSAFAKISGTATATLGGAVRYVAPPQFENLSGAITARMVGMEVRAAFSRPVCFCGDLETGVRCGS